MKEVLADQEKTWNEIVKTDYHEGHEGHEGKRRTKKGPLIHA